MSVVRELALFTNNVPLLSLQYVDKLLIQLEVPLTAKLQPQPKNEYMYKKKIKQFRHLYYRIVFKAWIFFMRTARKNLTALKEVVQVVQVSNLTFT
jgi:hypothetical protein